MRKIKTSNGAQTITKRVSATDVYHEMPIKGRAELIVGASEAKRRVESFAEVQTSQNP